MEYVEHISKGRKYRALADGSGQLIVQVPPEGMVDELGLPEPLATNLHNILYARGLWNYQEVVRRPQELRGALQEALQLDIQKMTEFYFRYSGGAQ